MRIAQRCGVLIWPFELTSSRGGVKWRARDLRVRIGGIFSGEKWVKVSVVYM